MTDYDPQADGCTVTGCGKRVLARGWCSAHYTRWKRTGDPLGSNARSPICVIAGCGKRVHGHGLCDAHYSRRARHGDPLGGNIGRAAIPEFLASVSRHEGDDCLTWPFSRYTNGYGQVHRNGRSRGAHNLVCEMVHGPRPSPRHQAAHSCGKGHEGCVNPNHLSWKTLVENEADKLIHGTHKRGERNHAAVLNAEQAREIRALRGRVTQRELATRFGIARSTVASIQQNRTWAWLP